MTDFLYFFLMMATCYCGSSAFVNAVFLREKWAGFALTAVVSFSLIFVIHFILDTQ